MKKICIWIMAVMMLSQPGMARAQEGMPSAAAEADQMADDFMQRGDDYGDDFILGADEDSEDQDESVLEESLEDEKLLDIQEDTLDQE